MQHDPVTHGDLVLDNRGVCVRADMDHSHVLNICPSSDAYEIDVTADDRAEPNARIFADLDIADNSCVLGDKCRISDLWHDFFERQDHFSYPAFLCELGGICV